jgi:hypothetical protein
VKCSTCGAKLKAPDCAAGRPLECPHCSQIVAVPAERTAPPPNVAGPGESSDFEIRTPKLKPRRNPDDRDELDDVAQELEERRSKRHAIEAAEDAAEADRAGATSIFVGVTAMTCLALGFLTCGLTYWVAAPMAVAGAICSLFSHSRLKFVGLAINVVAFVPAVLALHTIWVAINAPAPPPQPFVR